MACSVLTCRIGRPQSKRTLRVPNSTRGAGVSDGKNPITFTDVTGSSSDAPAGTGKLIVTVNLPKGLKDGKIFEFRVSHDDGIDPILGPVKHFGASTVHISHSKNLGGAQ